MTNIFTLSTDDIIISAQPEYMDSESSPTDDRYVWIYHIKIQNNGKYAIKVVNRYWHITDGKGVVQEVHGEGVVGLKPIIMPGEHFEYTSSVSLSTPTGIMHGEYQVQVTDDIVKRAQIPVFSLDSTEAIRLAN